MFEMVPEGEGRVRLRGRLDAVQAERQAEAFGRLAGRPLLDCAELDYISSAGLGILFATHKRLVDAGGGVRLANLKPHIRELFAIAHFDSIFQLE